jgi:hypothetical protein
MPAMADADAADAGEDASDEFNAAAWAPDNCEYGLFYLMVIRQGLEEKQKLTKPAEVENLKVVGNDTLQKSMPSSTKVSRRHKSAGESDGDESDDVSEGLPWEESDVAPWTGKRSSWWRVHTSLGEDLVVRSGLSLASGELCRIAPGEVVQQAGAARMLRQGYPNWRQQGCIRLPVKPRGWVTADATRAGGPRYLVSANAPRWRVVYSSPNSSEGDAIVRSDPALDADEVAVLYCGDVVEQAGPSETRGQGIIRMPVTVVIQHDRKDGDEEAAPSKNLANASSSKVVGWVTIDSRAAGGPVFFKLAPDSEVPRRERRRGQGGKSAG